MLFIPFLSLANSFVLDKTKCSVKTNSEVICTYFGSDRLGGLSQKATHSLGLPYALHGVWGLESKNSSSSDQLCDIGAADFKKWYCSSNFVPILIDPYTSKLSCSDDNPESHSYHECRCHAAHYGISSSDWLTELNKCTNLTNRIVYPVNCRFSHSENCNYVQDWSTSPLPGTGCKSGYSICNPMQYPDYKTVSTPKSCVAYCESTNLTSIASAPVLVFRDDDLTTPAADTTDTSTGVTKQQWPDHKELTAFEWTIIALVIFICLVIIATFIVVIFLCHNGRVRRNPAPGYVHHYKSFRKRNLIALDFDVTYRETFNGPKQKALWKIIIGGSFSQPSEIASVLSSGSNFKEKVKKGNTRWTWKLATDANITFSRCFGRRDKLVIPWNFIERKFGRIDTVHSVKATILNENYTVVRSNELYTNESQPKSTANSKGNGSFNSEYSKLDNSQKNKVRVYFLRKSGNADIIYDNSDVAREQITQAIRTLRINNA